MKAMVAAVVVLGLWGCDDGGGGGAAVDARVATDAAGPIDARAADRGAADASPRDQGAAPDQGVPDLGTPDQGVPMCLDPALCFSHADCPAEALCLNLAPEGEDEAPCCVPGARGDGPTGADCSGVDGQRFCASGVCIEGDAGAFCSVRCDDTDCPAPFVRCVAIPLEAGVEAWCFP
ncbi:MAG: hypothetical protein R3F60_02005 [bacterium]